MKLSDQHGFTLVELMVALAITGIISAAMYAAYTSQQRVYQSQDQIVGMQQNLRAGLDMMTRELRMAGYDPERKWEAGFSRAEGQFVEFSMIAVDDKRDNDDDGVTDEPGELRTIGYGITDACGSKTLKPFPGKGHAYGRGKGKGKGCDHSVIGRKRDSVFGRNDPCLFLVD